MTGIKIAAVVAFLGGTGLVAEVLPLVPDGWQSWPATAILGFITVFALSALVWMAKGMGKALLQTANTLGKLGQQEEERGRRLDELAGKIGETNTQLLGLNANLKARPCIMDARALAKLMKKSQEIEP